METMYAPQNNGPHTTLAGAINSAVTSITVADASILPNAPNVLTIGMGEDAELVLMESKTGNILAVRRGYFGTKAKAWSTGDWIYRAITAQDLEALQKNIREIEAGNVASAPKLATARTIQTNLASTSPKAFDGSANITPGVVGTLGIPNGGTGATTVEEIRANLGLEPGKLLFSGSWSSGSVQIPQIYEYKLYIMATSSDSIHLIGIRTADLISVFSVYPSSSGNSTNAIRMSISGTAVSFASNQYMVHTASASNGSLNTGRIITGIYGIV